MSVTTVRTIFCDGCADWWSVDGETIDEPVSSARKRLKRLGWQVAIPTGNSWGGPTRDFCPTCAESGRGDRSE